MVDYRPKGCCRREEDGEISRRRPSAYVPGHDSEASPMHNNQK